ncbi:MAG: alpha/beta hydrolase [bacterium]|nr:alpha/beta hydrolase [bacterium]
MYTHLSNRKIHFKKYGSGKPLIMIHGWGGNLYSLHDLGSLASKLHTVYLIDLPGFGKSDNPPKHWGVEGYALMILDFISDQKLTKPDYFGHSFGGELGIYLAAHYPHTFRKLILCNSSYKRENKVSTAAQLAKDMPPATRFVVDLVKPILKKLYYQLFHRDSDLMKFPQLETNFRKIITHDLTEDVKKIKNDTLIVWGEEDTYTPAHWAYELKKLIPHAVLHVIPGATHNLPIKDPQAVWDAMKGFLLSSRT